MRMEKGQSIDNGKKYFEFFFCSTGGGVGFVEPSPSLTPSLVGVQKKTSVTWLRMRDIVHGC